MTTYELRAKRARKNDNTQWGNAITRSDGHDHIFGMSMSFTKDVFYGMRLARVPVDESLDCNDWSYWNGAGWVTGEAHAVAMPDAALIDGVTPLQDGSGFMGWASADQRAIRCSSHPPSPAR